MPHRTCDEAALAVLEGLTPNSVGLLPFSERVPILKEVMLEEQLLLYSPPPDYDPVAREQIVNQYQSKISQGGKESEKPEDC